MVRQLVFLQRRLLISRQSFRSKLGFLRNYRSTRKNNAFERESGRGRGSLAPFEPSECDGMDPAKLWKAAAFTTTFTLGSFTAVTILEYEKIRAKATSVFRNVRRFNWFRSKQPQQQPVQKETSQWQKDIAKFWNGLSPGERVFFPICFANLLVFGFWRVPRLQPYMIRYFCSNPAARAVCWPMILSTFSHYSAVHIFCNLFVLHSFSTAATSTLGREQFLGLYLSAGVFSSFTSYLYKFAIRQPGLSLGASGALMAILSYVCFQYPDTRLSILFLPMLTFPAGTAIQVIIGLDLAGIILKWKFFDHAAHLGGAAFGAFWCFYGAEKLWPQREYIIGWWHKFRGPISKS